MSVVEVSNEAEQGQPLPIDSAHKRSRLHRWLRLLAAFFMGQAALQLLNFVTGLFLLRWMNKLAYAQYSSAFAFQSSLNLLVDMGFSTCIVALTGDRGHDKQIVGSYIRSARVYRGRLFIVLTIVSAIVYPLVVQHQPWGPVTKALLWSAVIGSVFFQGRLLYSAPLLIHGRMVKLYKSQLAAGGFRFVSFGVLYFLRLLSGPLGTWIGTFGFAIQGALYRRHSSAYIDEPKTIDPAIGIEMRKYLAPLWPGMIFYAVQGQMPVVLSSFFGKTHNIAEVGALSRLAQIFSLLATMNPVIIEPLIARTPTSKIAIRTIQVFFLGSSLMACIFLLCKLFPGPIVYLLGQRYADQLDEVPWVVLASCLQYLTGLLYMISAARKWVVWAASIANILVIVSSEAYYLYTNDISSTHSVIILNVVVAVASLASMAAVTLRGVIGSIRSTRNEEKARNMETDGDQTSRP